MTERNLKWTDKKFSFLRKVLNYFPFLLAILVFICTRYSIHHPGFVEKYYSLGLYPSLASGISAISNLTHYSLWDIFWIVISLLVISGIVLVFLKRLKLKIFLLRFIQMITLIYSLFYLSWGFNYFRPGIEARLGWQITDRKENDFRALLDTLICNVNRTYTEVDYSEYKEIEAHLEDSYKNLSSQLGITWPCGTRNPKTILISSLFAKSGVSGYFGPLFNEVHINHYQLPGDYAFTLAHEKAHQLGLPNEAEANLAAFVVCTSSTDNRLRYSGYVHVLLYFLNDCRQMSDYKSYLKKIDTRVLSDLRHRKSYYDNLRNRTFEGIQEAANNAYLKSQNIEKGIENYNQVVSLVMNWYKNHGMFQPDETEIFAEIN
ncbi:MAG TPA: DUF3810 domain-containing protein [Bacteroidales bacterium]|nr:DUF3810 domain-containing protein [Bacteroidales bacterium]